MKALIKYARVWVHSFNVALTRSSLYRGDTFMLLFGVVVRIITTLLFFNFIYRSTSRGFGSWTNNEVIFLIFFQGLQWGLLKLLYGKAQEKAIDKIFDGSFDFYLLKPINARFLAFFAQPMIKGIPSILLDLTLSAIWFVGLGVELSLVKICLCLVYSVCGHIIAYSFFQIATSTAFLSGKSEEVYGILENAWVESKYPSVVFSGWVVGFLTFVVPITLFASFPVGILLGKVVLSLGKLVLPWAVTTGSVVFSEWYYRFALRRYSSASS